MNVMHIEIGTIGREVVCRESQPSQASGALTCCANLAGLSLFLFLVILCGCSCCCCFILVVVEGQQQQQSHNKFVLSSSLPYFCLFLFSVACSCYGK